ncbi:acrosin-like isoform X1 [Corvus kubaryi]|uniref:acrosin-like isoform X1 n=1 Tax=Corvus kubaryi TaxID=68294 RepID=UPI001C04C7CA|nr:acrosin-like isoform X1 [Corvus kubaryi]
MILLCILILLALCGSAHGTCGGICGLRPMHATFGSSRVVGGTDVLPGSGAWAGIASIRCFWKPPISVHVCGGTLIDAQWLLTAAHCFTNITNPISEWAVVLGATSLGQSGHEVEVRRIKRLIIHELYVPKLEYNDIALLELDRPVPCSSSIQLACLPGPTVKASELKNCYVAGWGDRIVKSSGRDILQQAKVQVVNNKLCNSSDWLQGYIHDFHVCAGQGGVGTCQVGVCYASLSTQQCGRPHHTTQAQPSPCFSWRQQPSQPQLRTAAGVSTPFPIHGSLLSEVQMPTSKHRETESPTLKAPNLLPRVSRFRRLQHSNRALLWWESSSDRLGEQRS